MREARISHMTQEKHFPSTSIAQRAASKPGPKTITALLEKVEFPNDYIHTPEGAGQCDENYFAVTFDMDRWGYPIQMENFDDFYHKNFGGNAWRKRDPKPVDQNQPHIILLDELKDKKVFADFYGWTGDFDLISEQLRSLIEELDPGSLDCAPTSVHDGNLDQPYWACISKRNLEAVDTSRTEVRILQKKYTMDDREDFYVQKININRGAVFDPEVTKGASHFWDIDLRQWFWSRELISKVLESGIRGPAYRRAGFPFKPSLNYKELEALLASEAL